MPRRAWLQVEHRPKGRMSMGESGARPGAGASSPVGRSPLGRLRPPPRMMLRDSVYEAIKGLLMDNDLAPGSRLSIDGLARELQVSPTPVREAMTRLESDGLVAKRPHAGYIVAPLMDRVALDNLYEIRLLIEPQAARLAA